jgi:hypothetical protein
MPDAAYAPPLLRRLAAERASGLCGYCLMPTASTSEPLVLYLSQVIRRRSLYQAIRMCQ